MKSSVQPKYAERFENILIAELKSLTKLAAEKSPPTHRRLMRKRYELSVAVKTQILTMLEDLEEKQYPLFFRILSQICQDYYYEQGEELKSQKACSHKKNRKE